MLLVVVRTKLYLLVVCPAAQAALKSLAQLRNTRSVANQNINLISNMHRIGANWISVNWPLWRVRLAKVWHDRRLVLWVRGRCMTARTDKWLSENCNFAGLWVRRRKYDFRLRSKFLYAKMNLTVSDTIRFNEIRFKDTFLWDGLSEFLISHSSLP